MKRRPQLVSLRDQIYDGIKELILTNVYEPGRIIPMEKLAEEFGVSPTPIREALIRLEAFGLVELIPNKGARVSGITPRDVCNIWELRLVLEPAAACFSAPFCDKEILIRLEKKICSLFGDVPDFAVYVQTDDELHRVICDHVPNQMLRETIQRIHQLSQRMRYVPERSSAESASLIKTVSEEHLCIIAALRVDDQEQIFESVSQHVRNGQERALRALEVEYRGGGDTGQTSVRSVSQRTGSRLTVF